MRCLLMGDVVRDRNKQGDGGLLEALEGEGGWVGGRVEQGSDVGWQLVIWSLSMKFDSSGCIVVGVGLCEDEVGIALALSL